MAKKTLQFVEKRLNVVSGNLDSIEQNIESYKKSIGRNDISSEGQLYLQNVSNNDQELAKINIQLSILNEIDSTDHNSTVLILNTAFFSFFWLMMIWSHI